MVVGWRCKVHYRIGEFFFLADKLGGWGVSGYQVWVYIESGKGNIYQRQRRMESKILKSIFVKTQIFKKFKG